MLNKYFFKPQFIFIYYTKITERCRYTLFLKKFFDTCHKKYTACAGPGVGGSSITPPTSGTGTILTKTRGIEYK